jgi:hypothetical protein
MCDCALTRVVLDAQDVPVNLGRTRRLFTGEQRRAILARDRECIWPTCHTPARWTQIHHIDWWDRDNGPTDVDKGAAMCGYHHHETHRRDLTITRIPPPARDLRARDDSPSGRRPRTRGGLLGALTPVRYEIRDRNGHLIGEPEKPPPARMPDPQRKPTARGRDDARPQHQGPTRPRLSEPPDDAAVADDELDLTPTTDPMTGMTVPAYFLDG